MGKDEKRKKLYPFLLKHAIDGSEFTKADWSKASGHSRGTVATYCSKQLKDFIISDEGSLRLRPEFARLSLGEFMQLTSQKVEALGKYTRHLYETVILFEFLLPLTHQNKLTQALNDLFYKESLVKRIGEIPEKK